MLDDPEEQQEDEKGLGDQLSEEVGNRAADKLQDKATEKLFGRGAGEAAEEAGGRGAAAGGKVGQAASSGGKVAAGAEAAEAGAEVAEGAALVGETTAEGAEGGPWGALAGFLAGIIALVAPPLKKPVKAATNALGKITLVSILGALSAPCISFCSLFCCCCGGPVLILVVLIVGIFSLGKHGTTAQASPIDTGDHNSALLQIVKSGPGAISKGNPGESRTITYQFEIKNTSSADATGVFINDLFSGRYSDQVDGKDTCQINIGLLRAGESMTKFCSVTIRKMDDDWTLANLGVVSGRINGNDERTTATALVIIGTLTNCYTFDDTWSADERAQEQEAIDVLAQSSSFMSLVCAGGSVDLSRGGGKYSGLTSGHHITIFGPDLGGLYLRLYILAHESGHVIGNMNPAEIGGFISNGIFEAEGLMPTYPKDFGLPGVDCSPNNLNIPYACYDESHAELTADYVVYKYFNFLPRSWSGFPGGVWLNNPDPNWDSFPTDRPRHFGFARDIIFTGLNF